MKLSLDWYRANIYANLVASFDEHDAKQMVSPWPLILGLAIFNTSLTAELPSSFTALHL